MKRALTKARQRQTEAAKELDDSAVALRPAVAAQEPMAADSASPAAARDASLGMDVLKTILEPLRTLQRGLEISGFDGVVANADQLYAAYLDSQCSDPIPFDLWKAKYIAHELQTGILARCDSLLGLNVAATAPTASRAVASAHPPRTVGTERSSPYRS